MKKNTNKLTAIIIILVFCFTWVLMPSTAQAKWHDNSDQLPGMSSGTTIALVAAGCVAVLAVVYVIAKPKSKKIKDDAASLDLETALTVPADSSAEKSNAETPESK